MACSDGFLWLCEAVKPCRCPVKSLKCKPCGDDFNQHRLDRSHSKCVAAGCCYRAAAAETKCIKPRRTFIALAYLTEFTRIIIIIISTCLAVIEDSIIRFAAYTAAETPNVFQCTEQPSILFHPIEMPFAGLNQMGTGNHVLIGSRSPTGRDNFRGFPPNWKKHCETSLRCAKNGWTDPVEQMPFGEEGASWLT